MTHLQDKAKISGVALISREAKPERGVPSGWDLMIPRWAHLGVAALPRSGLGLKSEIGHGNNNRFSIELGHTTDFSVELEGLGEIHFDVACGGNFYAIIGRESFIRRSVICVLTEEVWALQLS